ncbi:MAG: metallophosphoesterase [Alphaproteobacteria bacterium]|nr:metallophosphoesterase [Alphaproteobacteria bacterium]
MKVPSVRLMTVSSNLLPTDWKPVTVAVLSDLHISSTSKMEKQWLNAVVRKTNDLKADMIFITGDIIDDDVTMLSEQIKPLFKLRAPYGVYMSFGNHEMFNDSKNWEDFFKKNGMIVLNDEIKQVIVEHNTLMIAGIYQNEKLLNGFQTDYPILLLAHYPAIAKKVPADKVFLQLSGHTHGGQFGILNPIIAKFNQGFVRGLYFVGQSQLYVHSGTGLWQGFPFRFLTPSEITMITICSKKN